MYTSRSAVETYHDCMHMRYLQYHWGGTGVMPVQKSVPLVTGSAVHRGIEHLMNRIRIGEVPNVDTAVNLAVEQYKEDVGKVGFGGTKLKVDAQQWFTFLEQKALVEGLLRAWAIVEMPVIMEKYQVVAVEREIEPIEIGYRVFFQAKVDAEMRDKGSGEWLNYSIKTSTYDLKKDDTGRYTDAYKGDLQGVTEIWSVEEDARRNNDRLSKAISVLENAIGRDKNLETMQAYLRKKRIDKKVSGIRFCFLIKGKWMLPPSEKDKPGALKVTYSPLIRGYKNISPDGVAYAHSWNYPNPANASGKSVLGKGWTPFNVWEEMGVKAWVEMIQAGQVQPDVESNPISGAVVVPEPYWRSEWEVREIIEEVKAQEIAIANALQRMDGATGSYLEKLTFPHNKKHCFFSYGDVCAYYQACWSPEVRDDLIGSGLYQIRVPHHEAERRENGRENEKR